MIKLKEYIDDNVSDWNVIIEDDVQKYFQEVFDQDIDVSDIDQNIIIDPPRSTKSFNNDNFSIKNFQLTKPLVANAKVGAFDPYEFSEITKFNTYIKDNRDTDRKEFCLCGAGTDIKVDSIERSHISTKLNFISFYGQVRKLLSEFQQSSSKYKITYNLLVYESMQNPRGLKIPDINDFLPTFLHQVPQLDTEWEFQISKELRESKSPQPNSYYKLSVRSDLKYGANFNSTALFTGVHLLTSDLFETSASIKRYLDHVSIYNNDLRTLQNILSTFDIDAVNQRVKLYDLI